MGYKLKYFGAVLLSLFILTGAAKNRDILKKIEKGEIKGKEAIKYLKNFLEDKKLRKKAIILLGKYDEGRDYLERINLKDREDKKVYLKSIRRGKRKKDLDEILKFLNDNDKEVEKEALLSLGEIATYMDIKGQLLIRDKIGDKKAKRSARKFLGDIEYNKIILKIRKYLSNRDKLIRIYAARVLGHWGDKSGLKVALESLTDEDPKIRLESVLSLKAIGDTSDEVVLYLKKAMSDKNKTVRFWAKEVLRRWGVK